MSLTSSQSQEPPKLRVSYPKMNSSLRNSGTNFSQLNMIGSNTTPDSSTPFAILNLKKQQNPIVT